VSRFSLLSRFTSLAVFSIFALRSSVILVIVLLNFVIVLPKDCSMFLTCSFSGLIALLMSRLHAPCRLVTFWFVAAIFSVFSATFCSNGSISLVNSVML